MERLQVKKNKPKANSSAVLKKMIQGIIREELNYYFGEILPQLLAEHSNSRSSTTKQSRQPTTKRKNLLEYKTDDFADQIKDIARSGFNANEFLAPTSNNYDDDDYSDNGRSGISADDISDDELNAYFR